MVLDGLSGWIEAEPWEFGGSTSVEALVRVDRLRWSSVIFDFLDGKFNNQLAFGTHETSDSAVSFGKEICLEVCRSYITLSIIAFFPRGCSLAVI